MPIPPTVLRPQFFWPQDGQRTEKSLRADKAEAKKLKIGKVGGHPRYTDTCPSAVVDRLNDRQKRYLNVAYANLLAPGLQTLCGVSWKRRVGRLAIPRLVTGFYSPLLTFLMDTQYRLQPD